MLPIIVNSFTIVYKMKLYCAQQYKRSIIQSSLSIGSLLGLIIMNVVSDLKGRRFALLVDLLLAITSSFCNDAILLSDVHWCRVLNSASAGPGLSAERVQRVLAHGHQLHHPGRHL